MGGPPTITPGGCTGGGGFSTTKLPAVVTFQSARFKERRHFQDFVCVEEDSFGGYLDLILDVIHRPGYTKGSTLILQQCLFFY